MITYFSLRASTLKCIGAEPQGFEEIKRINLIVGRNNSGKSSLLDLVELAVKGDSIVNERLWHAGKPPAVFMESLIESDDLDRSFPSNTSGGHLGGNHRQYGERFLGKTLRTRLLSGGKREFNAVYDSKNIEKSYADEARNADSYFQALAAQPHRNPLQGKIFWKIAAERNIVPEADRHGTSIEIAANGVGATDALQQFLNKVELDRDLVRVFLLDSINRIFAPDAIFDEIICRQLSDQKWEIFLGEKAKGLVALSHSGSGIKTIILALCFIHLAPLIKNKPLGEFILAFEELENNLHPTLQRRLLDYLTEKAAEHRFTLFLTTHSNVAIDLLNKNSDAQILHVTHDGSSSVCRTVRAFVDHGGLLDDLDVRASDLLQSNGIIWVEGPSDRVYLARWINLWSHGELAEGNNYQCVFYGGRLLSHLSAEDPDSADDGVAILRVNRNACIVIDSDRRSMPDEINATKRRIISEMQAIGALSWVTDGREIENYIPFPVLQEYFPHLKLKSAPKAFESLFDFLDKRDTGLGKRHATKKAVLAEAICKLTTREHLQSNVELSAWLTTLCEKIRAWNRLPEPTSLRATAG